MVCRTTSLGGNRLKLVGKGKPPVAVQLRKDIPENTRAFCRRCHGKCLLGGGRRGHSQGTLPARMNTRKIGSSAWIGVMLTMCVDQARYLTESPAAQAVVPARSQPTIRLEPVQTCSGLRRLKAAFGGPSSRRYTGSLVEGAGTLSMQVSHPGIESFCDWCFEVRQRV